MPSSVLFASMTLIFLLRHKGTANSLGIANTCGTELISSWSSLPQVIRSLVESVFKVMRVIAGAVVKEMTLGSWGKDFKNRMTRFFGVMSLKYNRVL